MPSTYYTTKSLLHSKAKAWLVTLLQYSSSNMCMMTAFVRSFNNGWQQRKSWTPLALYYFGNPRTMWKKDIKRLYVMGIGTDPQRTKSFALQAEVANLKKERQTYKW